MSFMPKKLVYYSFYIIYPEAFILELTIYKKEVARFSFMQILLPPNYHIIR